MTHFFIIYCSQPSNSWLAEKFSDRRPWTSLRFMCLLFLLEAFLAALSLSHSSLNKGFLFLKLSLMYAYNGLSSDNICWAGGSWSRGNYNSYNFSGRLESLKYTTRFTYLSKLKNFVLIFTTFLSFDYFKIDLIWPFIGFSTFPWQSLLYRIFPKTFYSINNILFYFTMLIVFIFCIVLLVINFLDKY